MRSMSKPFVTSLVNFQICSFIGIYIYFPTVPYNRKPSAGLMHKLQGFRGNVYKAQGGIVYFAECDIF